MATQPDDEPLELTEALEPDESEEQQDDPNPETNDEDGEQTVVAFEGEEPAEPEPENSTIRQMRLELRETKRKLAEAERASQPKPVEVGPKPGLWDDDIAGDEEIYDARLLAWKAATDAANRQTETQAEQSRKANEEWQQDVASFQQKKTALQFDDASDTIDTAIASLSDVQQAVIVKAAADPALFLYALGKSDAKRSELAKIQDPIKLAAAVALMEGAVKVTTRKAPAPDRPLTGSARMPVSGGEDKELARLEKEADRTGNRTAVIAYKRAQKEAAAAKGK